MTNNQVGAPLMPLYLSKQTTNARTSVNKDTSNQQQFQLRART